MSFIIGLIPEGTSGRHFPLSLLLSNLVLCSHLNQLCLIFILALAGQLALQTFSGVFMLRPFFVRKALSSRGYRALGSDPLRLGLLKGSLGFSEFGNLEFLGKVLALFDHGRGFTLIDKPVHVVVPTFIVGLDVVIERLAMVDAETTLEPSHPHHLVNQVKSIGGNFPSLELSFDQRRGVSLLKVSLLTYKGVCCASALRSCLFFLDVSVHSGLNFEKSVIIFFTDHVLTTDGIQMALIGIFSIDGLCFHMVLIFKLINRAQHQIFVLQTGHQGLA